MRKKYEESFKVKVALASLQEGVKVNEVAAKYESGASARPLPESIKFGSLDVKNRCLLSNG